MTSHDRNERLQKITTAVLTGITLVLTIIYLLQLVSVIAI